MPNNLSARVKKSLKDNHVSENQLAYELGINRVTLVNKLALPIDHQFYKRCTRGLNRLLMKQN